MYVEEGEGRKEKTLSISIKDCIKKIWWM